MMSPFIFNIIIAGGVIGYIMVGMTISVFLRVKLNWRDNDETFMCAAGWPLFIAFWLGIGLPAVIIMWLHGKTLRLAKRGSRKTYTSEVK